MWKQRSGGLRGDLITGAEVGVHRGNMRRMRLVLIKDPDSSWAVVADSQRGWSVSVKNKTRGVSPTVERGHFSWEGLGLVSRC